MAADGFEKTNLGWQVQQIQQQVWEWLELKLSQTQPNLSNWSLPSWLRNLSLPDWFPKAIFWLIVGLLMTWVGLQVWRFGGSYINSLPSRLQNLAQKAKTQKVSELRVSDWLARSHEFQRQGNYREAFRCLYMGMLQRLNDAGIAPHQLSRTDGEYLQLIDELPQQESYQTLLTTHEQLCFGNAEISEPLFGQCQQAYREIQGLEAK